MPHRREKHVLTETNYCATMYEQPRIRAKYPPFEMVPRCTAAGRYMDTEGRVICARCAAGRMVVKLSDAGKLIEIVDQIASSEESLTSDQREQLRALVNRMEISS